MHRPFAALDRFAFLHKDTFRAARRRPTRAALAVAVLGVSSIMFAPAVAAAATPPTVTETFSATGTEQSFTVPTGVSSVRVEAIGAAGESGFDGTVGGSGADVVGQLPVTAGEILYVEVAASGFGGAGAGNEGGGNGGECLRRAHDPHGNVRLAGIAVARRRRGRWWRWCVR